MPGEAGEACSVPRELARMKALTGDLLDFATEVEP